MSHATTLIDGNNFYASCEKSADPSLNGRPLVILSNNDGCIIARSAEAHQYGIRMGEPYFKVQKKLHDIGAVVRSSNYALYGDMSARLMSLLKKHCAKIEIYSIDEAFAQIDLRSTNNIRYWAQDLRSIVYQNLGLPIAIGIGKNKVQAKIANHLAKKIASRAGIFNLLLEEDSDNWLEYVDIESVWGVGKKMSSWCRTHSINNARELRDTCEHKLNRKFGIAAMRIKKELQGECCFPVRSKLIPKKEICVSRSFSHPTTDFEDIRQSLSNYVVIASKKLRNESQKASTISVFMRTSAFIEPFHQYIEKKELYVPCNDTSILIKIAIELAEKAFKPNRKFVKVGVIMMGLQSSKYLQNHLLQGFNDKQLLKSENLMKTIDLLNDKYGNQTIGWASCGTNNKCRMRQEKLSKASTTRMDEIPTAYA